MQTIPCAVPTTDAKPPAGKPEPNAEKATGNSAVDAVTADLPDVPSALKIPLAERKAAWKGRKSTKPKADKLAGDLTLPRSIEKAGLDILKDRQMKEEISKEARLRALREKKAPPRIAGTPESLAEKRAAKQKKPTVAKASNGIPLPADPKKREAAVDKLARKEVPAKKKTGAKSTKLDAIAALLKKGCTTADILKATGWPSVSVPACARQLGVTLIKDKKPGEVTRYRVK